MESEKSRQAVGTRRFRPHLPDQVLMAAMHAVERSDRQNGIAVQLEVGQVIVDLHRADTPRQQKTFVGRQCSPSDWRLRIATGSPTSDMASAEVSRRPGGRPVHCLAVLNSRLLIRVDDHHRQFGQRPIQWVQQLVGTARLEGIGEGLPLRSSPPTGTVRSQSEPAPSGAHRSLTARPNRERVSERKFP